MRFAPTLALALVLAASVGAAHAEMSEPAMVPELESCIRTNAVKVGMVEPDLTKAVDFLVLDVCAVPVVAERERAAQVELDAQKVKQQAECDKIEAAQKDKPAADDDAYNEYDQSYNSCGVLDFAGGSTLYVTGMALQNLKPAPAAALASQLLLDLRISHSKPGQNH